MFGRKKLKTPGGQVYTLFDDMAAQPHLLVAGATGSGKSVVINGIIYNLLHDGPATNQLILVDPKQNELVQYRDVPHCIYYASNERTKSGHNEFLAALQLAENIVEKRSAEMHKRKLRTYDGGDVYLIIDELAFLMTSEYKKDYLRILKRLGMIARASRVHMICCTQTVKADVLPTTLTCNFDARVAMRTSTAQQSRMIADVAGCERFPSPSIEHKAYCYFRRGADLDLYSVPKYSEEQLDKCIDWWTSRKCIA